MCWKELGEPKTGRFGMAKLTATGTRQVYMVSMGFRPALIAAAAASQTLPPNVATAHAVLWPLFAACSLRVIDSTAQFRPEYIIPQMLLEWVRASEDMDGVRYYSTRIEEHLLSPRLAANYVIPVKSVGEAGHCPKLLSAFRMSSVIVVDCDGKPSPYDGYDGGGEGLYVPRPSMDMRTSCDALELLDLSSIE